MRPRYLRPALTMPQIYLYRAPIDFRKQAHGLAALSEEKFKWPSSADELLSLSSEQINWLLDGYDISLMQGHKTLHYETL